MAPETIAQAPSDTDESPRTRRRRRLPGSNIVLAGVLIASATAASLWVTGVGAGARVAAAGTSSSARSTASPAPAVSIPGFGILDTGIHNTLRSADGSLDTTVSTYADCSGATELTHSEAAVDTCVSGRTYFVGHNSGVFTPLLSLGVGDVITWYDNGGAAHRLRIVAVRDNWLRDNGVPPLANGNVVAQFQTCETAYPDGSHDRILDAVAA
jgi:hypothetical protein